jgi:hypothetical protein
LPPCGTLLIRGSWVRAPRGPQTQVSTVSVSSSPGGAWLGWAVPGARERFAAADHVANIIVRNLLNGCRTFTEIRQGAPGNLDGVAGSASRGAGAARSADTHSEPSGRGATYELTVGLALRTVMDAMGRGNKNSIRELEHRVGARPKGFAHIGNRADLARGFAGRFGLILTGTAV